MVEHPTGSRLLGYVSSILAKGGSPKTHSLCSRRQQGPPISQAGPRPLAGRERQRRRIGLPQKHWPLKVWSTQSGPQFNRGGTATANVRSLTIPPHNPVFKRRM